MDPPRRMLVPVDLSKRAETAVEYAAMLAHGLGAELVLATNVNLPERALLEDMMEDPGTPLDQVAHAALESMAAAHAPDLEVSTIVNFRDFPAEGILDAIAEAAADLVVIASHGRSGMTRWMLGSVAEKIARSADVPVVIVPAR